MSVEFDFLKKAKSRTPYPNTPESTIEALRRLFSRDDALIAWKKLFSKSFDDRYLDENRSDKSKENAWDHLTAQIFHHSSNFD